MLFVSLTLSLPSSTSLIPWTATHSLVVTSIQSLISSSYKIGHIKTVPISNTPTSFSLFVLLFFHFFLPFYIYFSKKQTTKAVCLKTALCQNLKLFDSAVQIPPVEIQCDPHSKRYYHVRHTTPVYRSLIRNVRYNHLAISYGTSYRVLPNHWFMLSHHKLSYNHLHMVVQNACTFPHSK